MSMRVYFCGEVVADFKETSPGSGDFKLLLGGSLFHGATGAKRSVNREGVDIIVGFVGPLSTDMFGERFWKILKDMDIDTEGTHRVDRNTTTAIVSVRPGAENGFVFYHASGADEMTHIEDLPQSLGKKGDHKIFCFGSISTVLEPARFAWLEFAKQQTQDSLVFYDLNTRPKIAKNPVTYRPIVLEWAETAHIMKASDADIMWAYPNTSLSDVAKIWLDAGAQMAVFTKGPNGSEAYTKKVNASAASDDITAEITIGAGDNFNAGLVIQLAKAGIYTPEQVADITAEQLTTVLAGANRNSAHHLVSYGAKPNSAAAIKALG